MATEPRRFVVFERNGELFPVLDGRKALRVFDTPKEARQHAADHFSTHLEEARVFPWKPGTFSKTTKPS